MVWFGKYHAVEKMQLVLRDNPIEHDEQAAA
jgi:hypothetical protein